MFPKNQTSGRYVQIQVEEVYNENRLKKKTMMRKNSKTLQNSRRRGHFGICIESVKRSDGTWNKTKKNNTTARKKWLPKCHDN